MHRSRPLLAAALIAASLTACGPKAGAHAPSAPPIAVDIVEAHRQDIATTVSLDGQIAPVQQATLSTPQSGNVVAVYVTQGVRVHRGELLARLDDSTLEAQLHQQDAVVAQTAAQLNGANLQYPVTTSAAASTIQTAQQQLAAARNAVATAQAAYVSARSAWLGDKALLGQGYVAQTTYDQANAAYVQALQALDTARQTERQTEVGLRAAQAQGTNAAPIQAQTIAATRGQLGAAKAQVQLLQTEISQTRIVAPFDGVVTQRLLDPGAFAGPNQPVLQVSQIDPVYVNVNVPDSDLGYVHPGTPVTFTTSSLGDRTYRASVMEVNATPTTGTLSYQAQLRVPNPDDRLRGGMLVSVAVRTAFHPDAIVVPRTAVFQQNGAQVYTVVSLPAPPAAGPAHAGAAGGAPPIRLMQAKAVPVQLGIETDTLAEIRSPQITAGTPVIATQSQQLQDRSTVAIAGPAAGAAAQ